MIWIQLHSASITYNGLVKFGLDLSQQPIKSLCAKTELLSHSLRAEGGAQMDVEQQSGIFLGLPT